MTTTRKKVQKRQVGELRLGPISVLRITYADGRRSWGVSQPGCLALFGSDRKEANRHVRRTIELFGKKVPHA